MQGDFQHHWTPLDNSGIFQMGGPHYSTWPFGECPRVKINEWKTKPCLWAWSGQWVIGRRGFGAETCMRKWVSHKHIFVLSTANKNVFVVSGYYHFMYSEWGKYHYDLISPCLISLVSLLHYKLRTMFARCHETRKSPLKCHWFT